MHADAFYQTFAEIMTGPAEARHPRMADLHTQIITPYLDALHAITPEGAARIVPDGRTVAQVVGHILEWERYLIISTGEVLAGVEAPGIMAHVRYVEPDGMEFAHRDVESFNARQTEKYAELRWDVVQARAIRAAATLHRLFTDSGLVTAEVLDGTRLVPRYRLPGGETLPITCGWLLWMIELEHVGIEHAADVALGCVPA